MSEEPYTRMMEETTEEDVAGRPGEPSMDPAPVADESPPTRDWSIYKKSILVMGLIGLTDAIEYGVIMPSLYLYLEQIQGHSDTKLYGAVIAVFLRSRSSRSPCLAPGVTGVVSRSSTLFRSR